MRSKMVLVFDGLEDLKEYYGKEILININVPTEDKYTTLQGFKYHSSEYTILKPMPEKNQGVCEYGNEEFIQHAILWNSGWNDCIDKILGEENEQKT